MQENHKPIKKILIIDDEKDLLELLTEVLKSIAEVIFACENGEEALSVIEKESPDIIVSDYHMPKLNGLELLKSLNEQNLKIPVIWTTGHAKSDLQAHAWNLGVYEILEKPFDLETLKRYILSASDWKTQGAAAPLLKSIEKMAAPKIQLVINPHLYKKLLEITKKNEISLTTYINNLIEKAIKEQS